MTATQSELQEEQDMASQLQDVTAAAKTEEVAAEQEPAAEPRQIPTDGQRIKDAKPDLDTVETNILSAILLF